MSGYTSDGRDLGRRPTRTFFCGCSTKNAAVNWEEFYANTKRPECIEFKRNCSICGTQLNAYNKSDICYLCQDEMSQEWKERNWKW